MSKMVGNLKGWKREWWSPVEDKIYKTQISLRKLHPWSKGYPVFLRHPVHHYWHASARKHRITSNATARAYINSRRQISCALWLANVAGGIDTIFPDGGSRYSGPFHARFNRDSSTPLHNGDRRDEKSSNVSFGRRTGTARPEIEILGGPCPGVALSRAPERARLHVIRYVKPLQMVSK